LPFPWPLQELYPPCPFNATARWSTFFFIFHSASFWAYWCQLTNTLVATSKSWDALMHANLSNFCNFILMFPCTCPTEGTLIICWFSGTSGLKGEYAWYASHSLL
jgi:hypothetical protein